MTSQGEQRTSGLEWILVSLTAVVLPPAAMIWAFYRAVQSRSHEWLAWWTVLAFSIVLTTFFALIVVKNGGSLR